MRKQDLPSDHWIDRFGEWLQVQGFMHDTHPLNNLEVPAKKVDTGR
jgi:hypothetical protein